MADREAAGVQIEVVYAAAADQIICLPLRVAAGTTLREAVIISGILDRCPEISLERNRIGIFGKICPPDTLLSEGDRIEIYRPVTADPKAMRRRRAVEQRSRED